MAAYIRPKFVCRLIGNVILRTNQHFSGIAFGYFYRNQECALKNVVADISKRMLTTSTIRWTEIETKSETNTPQTHQQQELTDAELLQAIEYLNSEEYVERYGEKPVWANYKRNHKGRVPPMKTRKQCIRGHGEKQRICGNPCPICRDSGLQIHYKNVKLLEQFICPHSWNIYSTYRTGLCRKQNKKLCAAIEKAREHGVLPYSVPFVKYQYQEFYPSETDPEERKKSVNI